MTRPPCSLCGHDAKDHAPDNDACPIVKPYISGVVDVWNYHETQRYKPEGEK